MRRPSNGQFSSTALIAALLLLAAVCPSRAVDTWSDPAPGIRRLHRTTSSPKRDINVLVVDLTNPNIGVLTLLKNNSTQGDSGQTVPDMCADHVSDGVIAAINADYFSFTNHKPESNCIINGNNKYDDLWPTRGATEENRTCAAFGWDNAPIIRRWGIDTGVLQYCNVVGGGPTFVWDGKYDWDHWHDIFGPGKEDEYRLTARAQTIVGLSKDNKTLFLMTVDETNGNQGMTPEQTVPLLRDLGAWSAMKMDGGGSTTMWLKGNTLHPVGGPAAPLPMPLLSLTRELIQQSRRSRSNHRVLQAARGIDCRRRSLGVLPTILAALALRKLRDGGIPVLTRASPLPEVRR